MRCIRPLLVGLHTQLSPQSQGREGEAPRATAECRKPCIWTTNKKRTRRNNERVGNTHKGKRGGGGYTCQAGRQAETRAVLPPGSHRRVIGESRSPRRGTGGAPRPHTAPSAAMTPGPGGPSASSGAPPPPASPPSRPRQPRGVRLPRSHRRRRRRGRKRGGASHPGGRRGSGRGRRERSGCWPIGCCEERRGRRGRGRGRGGGMSPSIWLQIKTGCLLLRLPPRLSVLSVCLAKKRKGAHPKSSKMMARWWARSAAGRLPQAGRTRVVYHSRRVSEGSWSGGLRSSDRIKRTRRWESV